MHSRRLVAAVAGVAGAAIAHALDVGGLLPFVHESAEVRGAMSPMLTLGWLALTAALAAVTARRPATAGAGVALVVSGLPELAGRLDPGAVFEPAAVAGALLQWLLLVLVLTLAFALHAGLDAPPAPALAVADLRPPRPMRTRRLASRLATRSGRTRAPPVRRGLRDSDLSERTVMHRRMRGRIVAAGVLVPLVVTLTACSDKDKEEANKAAGADCPSSISQQASTPLPSDVPAPSGADSAYQYSKQGATQVWFFAVDGEPGDLASLRDSYDDTLKGKGYDIKDTDQEDGAEAESEFDGPHDGTTNFRPLCKGKVTLRLKLES